METFAPIVLDGRRTASVPAPRFHRVQAPVSEEDLGLVPGARRRRARELHDTGGLRVRAWLPYGRQS